ncbi:hypothetical protein [Hyphomicrobium sp. MC8b]|jgi:hypothetical protein|uniref:hypothetical protein n=1 Tax=unclassified Hyphomicrobium TaxID=2619925 RepID=UPI00391B120D
MANRVYSYNEAAEHDPIILADVDEAAAVYPDHDIVTRHFDRPLTIGDFVSSIADGADGHGGLPTYLRITLQGDATKIRRLMADKPRKARTSKRSSH